jgi:hypothetical protein
MQLMLTTIDHQTMHSWLTKPLHTSNAKSLAGIETVARFNIAWTCMNWMNTGFVAERLDGWIMRDSQPVHPSVYACMHACTHCILEIRLQTTSFAWYCHSRAALDLNHLRASSSPTVIVLRSLGNIEVDQHPSHRCVPAWACWRKCIFVILVTTLSEQDPKRNKCCELDAVQARSMHWWDISQSVPTRQRHSVQQ